MLLDPIYTLAAWEASDALLRGRELVCSRDGGPAPPPSGTSPSWADSEGAGRLLRSYALSAAQVVERDGCGGPAAASTTASAAVVAGGETSGGAAAGEALQAASPGGRVVMLHTGGALGLFGLAQTSEKLAAEMRGGGGSAAAGTRT